jgi:hypothetical protein
MAGRTYAMAARENLVASNSNYQPTIPINDEVILAFDQIR